MGNRDLLAFLAISLGVSLLGYGALVGLSYFLGCWEFGK